MSELYFDKTQLLLNASLGLDFSARVLSGHHKRVTIIALKMGLAAGLDEHTMNELCLTSIIHDIGAVNWDETSHLGDFDIENPFVHCINGYNLLVSNPLTDTVAHYILSHHDRWQGDNVSGLTGSLIPLVSRIIHLADRIDVSLKADTHVLNQRDHIISEIKERSGSLFDPDLVDLFTDLAVNEDFWLDLAGRWEDQVLASLIPPPAPVPIDEVLDLALLFGQVVDLKSPFTYRHSIGVGEIAAVIGRHLGLGADHCRLLKIAGLLHDIGKLSIPNSILEKPGALTTEEFNIMKQHTYYTYWLLKPLNLTYPLAEWAAYHHERLDGQGYPFHRTSAELSLEARIMAVADVLTALCEDRPYRPGLPWNKAAAILRQQAAGGAIDPLLVELVIDKRREIEQLWAEIA